VEGETLRPRSESFADHYSQARLFYRSITEPEQRHMANAITFELSKVETPAIRARILGHLQHIDEQLFKKVSSGLGADGKAESIVPAKEPIDLPPSPALRLYGRYKPTLKGRKVGLLLGAGFDSTLKKNLTSEIEKEGAEVAVITTKIAGEADAKGKQVPSDMSLRASPSVLFDAVAVLAGPEGDKQFANDPNAVAFLMDAKNHCKAIGFAGISALAEMAHVQEASGIIDLTKFANGKEFVTAAREGRFWEREMESGAEHKSRPVDADKSRS
jgi:catalase